MLRLRPPARRRLVQQHREGGLRIPVVPPEVRLTLERPVLVLRQTDPPLLQRREHVGRNLAVPARAEGDAVPIRGLVRVRLGPVADGEVVVRAFHRGHLFAYHPASPFCTARPFFGSPLGRSFQCPIRFNSLLNATHAGSLRSYPACTESHPPITP